MIASSFIAFGQKSNIEFIDYLYKSQQYNHVITYSDYLLNRNEVPYKKDTLLYFNAKSHYQLQNFHASIINFEAIPEYFWGHEESRFLLGNSYLQINDFDNASRSLKQIYSANEITTALKYFELSGIALLQRNQAIYLKYDSLILSDYYFLSKERKSMSQVAEQLFSRKDKSPFVGGLLSAVVPGAGRFYAGKRGQAIYSFIITGFFALQTWESYQKSGPQSARFITYGSLLSLFHIANIWGSALSVKKYNHEYNEAADYRIKLDLLIPIRSFYK